MMTQPHPSPLEDIFRAAVDLQRQLLSKEEEANQLRRELLQVRKELLEAKDDRLVSWEWVCWYLDVEKRTAEKWLSSLKLYPYGDRTYRLKKSEVVQYAEQHSIKVKDIKTLKDIEQAAKPLRKKKT